MERKPSNLKFDLSTVPAEGQVKLYKTGYLTKQGGKWKSWKLRYFALVGTNMYYYKSAKETKEPLGVINLINSDGNIAIVTVADGASNEKKFLFQVGHPEERVYLISAENDEVRKDWIEVIINAIVAERERLNQLNILTSSRATAPPTTSPTEEKRATKREIERKATIAAIDNKLQTRIGAATVFQTVIRGILARRNLMVLKRAIVKCQSAIRGYIEKSRYRRDRRRVIVLQAIWRARTIKKKAKVLKKRLDHRTNTAREIVETEKSYVESLTTCKEVFIEPLLQKGIIPPDSVHLIFGNMSALLSIHIAFLGKLNERIKKWFPYQIMGDLFLATIGEFNSYLQYIVRYNKATEEFNNCLENEQFEEFLKEVRKSPRCNNLEVPDFLIMPVQRLPRYEMLLADLLKQTEDGTKDYPLLEKALSSLKSLTRSINEKKKEADSLQRLLQVEKKIVGKKGMTSFIKVGRILLKEGTVIEIQMNKGKFEEKKNTYLFLFSDSLMVSRLKKKILNNTMRFDYQNRIPIEDGVIVEDLKANPEFSGVEGQDCCFRITFNSAGAFVWKAENPFEKTLWITAFKVVSK